MEAEGARLKGKGGRSKTARRRYQCRPGTILSFKILLRTLRPGGEGMGRKGESLVLDARKRGSGTLDKKNHEGGGEKKSHRETSWESSMCESKSYGMRVPQLAHRRVRGEKEKKIVRERRWALGDPV